MSPVVKVEATFIWDKGQGTAGRTLTEINTGHQQLFDYTVR